MANHNMAFLEEAGRTVQADRTVVDGVKLTRITTEGKGPRVTVSVFTTYSGGKYLIADTSKLRPEYRLILQIGGIPRFKLAANLRMP